MTRSPVFLMVLALSALSLCGAVSVQSINGSVSGESVVVVSFKQQHLVLSGSYLSDRHRLSLQDGVCGDSVPLDSYHGALRLENVSSDGRSAVVSLPFNHTTYLGIYRICLSTSETGSDFSHFTGLFAAVRSLYQYCHKFGATAKAIRNCIKSLGDELDPRQSYDLRPSSFGDPTYRSLSEFESSAYYLNRSSAEERKYDSYQYPSESLNRYDFGMSRIPDGVFMMGSDVKNARTDPISGMSSPGDGEYPLRPARIRSFWMDRTEVTNGQFREFVRRTGYKTDAEEFGWSFVFESLLEPEVARESEYMVQNNPWWHSVNRAYWRQPYGPQSKVSYHLDHPVVHVSYRDAQSYCSWRGKRLPTEAEWEFASRGGLEQTIFPWGNEHPDQKAWKGHYGDAREQRCNLFQGEFPYNNTADDGWFGTSPVLSFAPNNYGLYDMVGNVWDWVQDEYRVDHGREWYSSVSPSNATMLPFDASRESVKRRVSKGGSFICFYLCSRNSARQGIDSDSSASNLGFRCAKDAAPSDPPLDYEIQYGVYVRKEALSAGVSVHFDNRTEGMKELELPPNPDVFHA